MQLPRESSTATVQLLLTPKQAAASLGISTRTLARLVARGDLAPVRIGAAVRFAVADLEGFVSRHRQQPAATT